MGEVYRAYDLILNQTGRAEVLSRRGTSSEAALAALPQRGAHRAAGVAPQRVPRLRHREVEGQHFLSMEYIDGEDLASLLRRIGRLPQDKAIEFARKSAPGWPRRTSAASCTAT